MHFLGKLILTAATLFLVSAAPAPTFFTFRILQDGKEMPVNKNKVELARKPFAIEFNFPKPIGVFVNASFDEQSYKAARKKKNLTQVPGFISTGMAEAKKNADREVLVCDKAPSYWYYDSEEDNRFDRFSSTNGSLVCVRTVEQLYLVDSKTALRLEDVKKDLYLVFLVKERGKMNDADIELQRESVQIKWK